jgi:hypothetical protein
MLTTAFFLGAAKWVGIGTLLIAALTAIAFIFKWGLRFRLVGATGFSIVLTAGLFTLSLIPFTRTVIPGAVRYSLVFDNGGTQVVVAVRPTVSDRQVEATLRQAASDLFSYGRLSRNNENQLTIRLRTIIHPEPGISKPLLLGQIERSLSNRYDENMEMQIFSENLAQLPASKEQGKG